MRARTVVDENGLISRNRVVYDTPCAKYGYVTRKLAKTVAKASAKESGENLQAYHCYVCHAHHVGHVPGGPRRIDEVG